MDKAARVTYEAWFRASIAERLQGNGSPEAYQDALRLVLISLGTQMGIRRGLRATWSFEPLNVAPTVLESMSPEDLGSLYQRFLTVRPCYNAENIEWFPDPESRRRKGAYYTPAGLIDRLLSFALDPLLPKLGSKIKVFDSACGSGAFLLKACHRIAAQTGCTPGQAAEHCVFGCDIDATAVALCRLTLWLHTGHYPLSNITLQNTLVTPLQDLPNGGVFNVIVGNPPFGSVLDRRVPNEVSNLRSTHFQKLGGTADLSYYFASKAQDLIAHGGRIGLVLPRAFLSAPSSKNLRAPHDPSFQLLESCRRTDAFEGASIPVCLVGYSHTGVSPQTAPDKKADLPLALELSASLTVGEAYDISAVVQERERGDGRKLLTTGLIDPGESHWGRSPCRFLKATYKFPRVASHHLRPLRDGQSNRPKLLVAGLSRTLECYLDAGAECLGSVGTYTILDPQNDVEHLKKVMDYLHSGSVHERFIHELGPSALSGGNITVTKPFLRRVLQDFESHLWESNPRPPAYKAGALPLS